MSDCPAVNVIGFDWWATKPVPPNTERLRQLLAEERQQVARDIGEKAIRAWYALEDLESMTWLERQEWKRKDQETVQ